MTGGRCEFGENVKCGVEKKRCTFVVAELLLAPSDVLAGRWWCMQLFGGVERFSQL